MYAWMISNSSSQERIFSPLSPGGHGELHQRARRLGRHAVPVDAVLLRVEPPGRCVDRVVHVRLAHLGREDLVEVLVAQRAEQDRVHRRVRRAAGEVQREEGEDAGLRARPVARAQLEEVADEAAEILLVVGEAGDDGAGDAAAVAGEAVGYEGLAVGRGVAERQRALVRCGVTRARSGRSARRRAGGARRPTPPRLPSARAPPRPSTASPARRP